MDFDVHPAINAMRIQLEQSVYDGNGVSIQLVEVQAEQLIQMD